MELNLSGLDLILPQDKVKPVELDLSGLDNILSESSQPTSKIVFQPENAEWSIGRLSSIEDFFLKKFSKPLPVSNVGQGKIHNKWNYDHRSSVDIGVNPSSKEGKELISYLKQNNIPFLAFHSAIPGVSTSPHIHVGKPSKKLNQDKDLNITGAIEPELNLMGLEEVLSPSTNLDLSGESELDLSGVGNIQAPFDLTFALDPRELDFKQHEKAVPALLEWATRYNKPSIIKNNPFEVGELIQTEFVYDQKPDVGTAISHLLRAWNPAYDELNEQFQAETGGLNLLNVQNSVEFIEDLGNNKYRVKARPTRASMALVEAYKNGGLREYNATLMLIDHQMDDIIAQQKLEEEGIDKFREEHPYLAAYESGVQSSIQSATQLGTNIKYLSKALATGNWYGYESKEYLDLINREKEEQEILAEISGTIHNPPSLKGKILAGAVQAGVTFPTYIAAGNLSPAGLPTMAYLENLHRGNREAALSALPMAILVGSGRGLGQFTDINPAGSSAPFRFIPKNKGKFTKEDFSVLQDTVFKGESISIAQLTPLERQLVHRGANALSLQFPTEGQTWQDVAANVVVGLGFPVGKSPRKIKYAEYVPTFKPIEIKGTGLLTGEGLPDRSRDIIQPRIGIPLTKSPVFGKFPIIEQGRDIPPVIYPSAESPKVEKYKEPFDPTTYVAETEKGFQARGRGETLHLDLDTANLNLLELKRSLEEKTYRVEGDDLKTVLQKQQAIKNAISILEQAIPEQTKEFFAQNEKVIRAALKSNYEARIGKENLIKRREEALKPNDVKVVNPENPKVENLKQSPKEIFGGKAGDFNTGVSQKTAADILKDFAKITTQGSLHGSILPYADVIARKVQDLSYLSAFYIEDFYRRGVVPTVDLVLNRIKGSIGEFGKYISDEQAKIIYNRGVDYYNSNVADPFFSKMKMDATERLPNKFTSEQARNILSQHKDEFEWTTGLNEFLEAKVGKKISKQELIDIIQKGQVRVEERVAEDNNPEHVRIHEALRNAIDRRTVANSIGDQKLAAEITKEINDLNNQLRKFDVPKYSLLNYTDEKLELPGAKNSKEVILTLPPKNKDAPTFPEFLESRGLTREEFSITLSADEQAATWKEYFETIGGQDNYKNETFGVLYTHAHWPGVENPVAHYRSNDRITTDNKKIYFGEEFQSDWNHDIRTLGLKIPKEKLLQEQAELRAEQDKIVNNLNYEERDLARNEQINNRLGELFDLINKNPRAVEPNPFMQHNWKELVIKRFLRDAAIAKDENGNYKYDGIGWTTARQQLERYGNILEGKEFKWQRNPDGTYSFDLKVTDPDVGIDQGEGFTRVHELNNISLERFAELTTKEAAQEVRDQESKLREQYTPFADDSTKPKLTGQFSLKEAVELRKGGGDKYADYDVALVNMAKKVGKRFVAKYEQKEIHAGLVESRTAITDRYGIIEAENNGQYIYNGNDNLVSYSEARKALEEGADLYVIEKNDNLQKVHYLEITPSMRQSLEKEGLPLYGLGGLEPLKTSEIGVRNVLTTREAFNSHRESLVKALESTIPVEVNENIFSKEERAKYEQAILDSNKEDLENFQLLVEQRRPTVFDSGMSADQFVDEAKLLYNNVESFPEFSKSLVQRFGEKVKPFLEDLWMQVKDIAKAFNEDEKGFLNLQFRRMQTEAEKKYRASKKSTFYYDWYSVHRGIMLAQSDPMASIVYDVIRTGQRDKNAFEYNVLLDLRSANKSAKRGTEQAVGEAVLIGNENQRLFTDAELAAGDPTTGRLPLNPDQIQAYKDAYKAEHRNLDKRLQQVLFGYRERADRLNNQLASTTPGTQAHTNILTNLLNIADAMNKVTAHYQYLKDTGYVSLKRKGPIAAFVQDPAFPIGDKRGEVYRQFNNVKEAGIWVAEQEKLLNANPADSNIYDINIPQRLKAAAARLTPAQFEDLIDSSGVNPRSPEIEALRDEIYSRFPSKGYELKRDYVRGYDRSWQFVLESIADQTEAYANSFYSRVAGEHAIKALEATGLQQDNVELYKILQKYIDHEITSPEDSGVKRFFTKTRKGVYLFQLGFDVNQLYLNAIAQPISQTYSYFARVSHNGKTLAPFEAEKYWIQAWDLAVRSAKKSITGKGNIPLEFEGIRDRLTEEGVLTPEFNKSLLESEVESSVSSKFKGKNIKREIEHWAGTFMRAGEKTTRTHAAAEAYLIGKNKFSLTGEDLVNFMVRSIDATQTNPSRAEAPLLIRGTQNQGEIRKLLYQFNAFNHMWIENLALNVRSDFQRRGISATSRHLIPVAIMGGISGLPLSGLMAGLYTLITNKDPKKEFHKYVNNFPLLERLALYGITGNATLSNKLTPTVPFTEQIRIEDSVTETLQETFAATNLIPAFSTGAQISRGLDDLKKGDKLRAIGGLGPIKPIRNLATATRYNREGIKTRKGTTILPRKKVTNSQLFFQGLGVPPSPLTEHYERKNREERTKTVKKLRKILQ